MNIQPGQVVRHRTRGVTALVYETHQIAANIAWLDDGVRTAIAGNDDLEIVYDAGTPGAYDYAKHLRAASTFGRRIVTQMIYNQRAQEV